MRKQTIDLLAGIQADAANIRTAAIPTAAQQATNNAVSIVTGPAPTPGAPVPWTRRQLMEHLQAAEELLGSLSDTLAVFQRSQVQAVTDLTSTLTRFGVEDATEDGNQSVLIASLQSVATSLQQSLDSNASLDLQQATDLTQLKASLLSVLTRLTTLENAAPLMLSTTKALAQLSLNGVTNWTVSVPGAAVGMYVGVSSSDALHQLATVVGSVTAAGVVTLRLRALVAVPAATYPFYLRVGR